MTGLRDLTLLQALVGPVPKLDLSRRRRAWWAIDQATMGILVLWLLR